MKRSNPGCLTMIMWALLILIAVLAVLIILQNRPREQEDRTVYQIKTEILLPDVTPVPAPTAWVRYPVPLEDDLQRYIGQVCRDYGVPTSVVFAVMEAETGGTFDPELKGDMYDGQYRSFGLMQVMAAEHTDRCVRLNAYNLLDAKQNIRVGVDFLAELLAYYDGDYTAALSFYNCDSTGDYAELVLSRAEILAESASLETY